MRVRSTRYTHLARFVRGTSTHSLFELTQLLHLG